MKLNSQKVYKSTGKSLHNSNGKSVQLGLFHKVFNLNDKQGPDLISWETVAEEYPNYLTYFLKEGQLGLNMEREHDYYDAKSRNLMGVTAKLNVICNRPKTKETDEQVLWRENCNKNQKRENGRGGKTKTGKKNGKDRNIEGLERLVPINMVELPRRTYISASSYKH